jgi:hypothetical protein
LASPAGTIEAVTHDDRSSQKEETPMYSLAEVEQVEGQYRHGIPSLGQALNMLVVRWRGGARDEATVFRLLFLLWYENVEPPSLTGISAQDVGLSFGEVFESIGGRQGASALVLWAAGKMAELFPWALGNKAEWEEASPLLLARAKELRPQIGPDYFCGYGVAGDYFRHLLTRR